MPRVFFSSRHGGLSTEPYGSLNLGDRVGDEPAIVTANRELLRKALSLSELVFMNQSHSADIAVITGDVRRMQTPDADALFTNQRGIGLAVMVADCLPLLLASNSWVAAVHVGRVGLMSGIVEKVLAEFGSHDSKPTQAWIGPHICSRCYEVSSDMYGELTSQRPLLATSTATRCLDLKTEVTAILSEAKVPVMDLGSCSVESLDHFSYRRDGVTGRFAGVISL